MTNPIDKDTTNQSDQEIVETVVADAAPIDAETEAQAEPEKKSHGGRNLILILLLIMIAVAGSLALSGKLMPLYESVTAKLQGLSSPQLGQEKDTTSAVPAPAVVNKPVPEKQPKIEQQVKPVSLAGNNSERNNSERNSSEWNSSEQNRDEQNRSEQNKQEQAPAVSPEQAQALLSSMDGLRDALQQMSRAQQVLQNGLKEQQQMNLQVRLRWITDPASRLPQLQLAWEEISLLPGLSEGQRGEAVRMHQLARARVQQLKQWQDALSKWADALVTPVQRNILPQSKYPWLNWIVNQFKLRQAASIEARNLGNLRARLLNAARHLTLESWPPKGEWQRLQAELLLQIRAMRHDGSDQNNDAIETGLPTDFGVIQADIKTLRHTALLWQHGGTQ